MRIAICDDSEATRRQICSLVQEYCSKHPEHNFTLCSFSQGSDLLAAIHTGSDFDIYLLDIVMPGMNGIDLGIALRQLTPHSLIIYLTTSQEYALDSYRVRALNYLLKPVSQTQLWGTLDEALHFLTPKKEKYFIVKTKESSVRIAYSDILYAELSHRAVNYHLEYGRIIKSTTLRMPFPDAMQELLSDPRFVLCGQSMVANLSHLTMVENDALIFEDTYKAYLGVKLCREIRSIWSDFWLQKEGFH